jgi:hypothetical protein
MEGAPKNEQEKIDELQKLVRVKKMADLFGSNERVVEFQNRLRVAGLLEIARKTKLFQGLISGFDQVAHGEFQLDLPDGEVERFIREEL